MKISCIRSLILSAIFCIVGISALNAQYFYFEEKPFMPVIDSGRYKLMVGGAIDVTPDMNFSSSFTLTRNLYVFCGYNVQNGNREWSTFFGGRKKSELDNYGSFYGVGLVHHPMIFGNQYANNLSFGMGIYHINNFYYSPSDADKLPNERVQARYNNYFIEYQVSMNTTNWITSSWPTRISLVDYKYLNYSSSGFYYAKEDSFYKQNLYALWFETGLTLNLNWKMFTLFGQVDMSFPLKSFAFKNNDLRGFSLNANLGLRLTIDFKRL